MVGSRSVDQMRVLHELVITLGRAVSVEQTPVWAVMTKQLARVHLVLSSVLHQSADSTK